VTDLTFMRLALRLARRGLGATSPNPMVGAVLVKRGQVIGQGWHRRAGGPHAEIEALNDARRRGCDPRGTTLYVTLEPCSTHGRTPPCTQAIVEARIQRVVVGTADPNPKHAGRAFRILRRSRIEVVRLDRLGVRRLRGEGQAVGPGRLKAEFEAKVAAACAALNESFNHWIVTRTPLVTVKAAMTLDGKIATASGESKWITGEGARAFGMKLRQEADAILVGVNTILADDPLLTLRKAGSGKSQHRTSNPQHPIRRLRRVVLDSMARTPLAAKVVSDGYADLTTIVVSRRAPKRRVSALAKRVNVIVAPTPKGRSRIPHLASRISHLASRIDLPWLLERLGSESVTSLLVEGGGEVNASFLLGGHAQRVALFYAPKILGGRDARKAVAGDGARSLEEALRLRDLRWKRLGPDWLLTGRVVKRET
jgi:diaminohydroxyphosphoribosylaminopyrimidine deaminase/5-amino-6-(5-phosphoribosylamino)uracil reductase